MALIQWIQDNQMTPLTGDPDTIYERDDDDARDKWTELREKASSKREPSNPFKRAHLLTAEADRRIGTDTPTYREVDLEPVRYRVPLHQIVFAFVGAVTLICGLVSEANGLIVVGMALMGLPLFAPRSAPAPAKVEKRDHILEAITDHHLGDSGEDEVDWVEFESDVAQVLEGKRVLNKPADEEYHKYWKRS